MVDEKLSYYKIFKNLFFGSFKWKRIIPKRIKQFIKKIITNNYIPINEKYFIYNNYKNNINCIEFSLTAKCNYTCEYCDEKYIFQKENANDKTIDSFIKFISKIHEKSVIKLIGGEPTIHPRFVEIANHIIKYNHYLHVGTNFSFNNELFKKLIDYSKTDNQIHLIISLHLSQIKSISEFIEKLISLKEYGNNKISIKVVSVLLEDKFEILKNIREKLMQYNIIMEFQRLKIESNGKWDFYNYTEKTEKYLKEVFIDRKASKIEKFNPFGMLCKAGYSFVRINKDGSINRCYDFHKKLYNLGNINNEWKLLKNIMPCLSDRCTCLLPVGWNLLMFDNYNHKLANKLLKEP